MPQLGGLGAATICSSNGTPVTITVVPQISGKRAKRSWVWQVFHEFETVISEKNVFCRDSKLLVKWKTHAGTRGKSEHYKKQPRRRHLIIGVKTCCEIYFRIICP